MAWMRTFLALALLSGVAPASPHQVQTGQESPVYVKPYRLVEITATDGQSVWILPWGGTTVPQAIEVRKTIEGSLVWTGPPGIYAVLWRSENEQGQTFVVIGDEPLPPPDPPGPGPAPPDPVTPRPDGFAGSVYDVVKSLDKPTADKIAGNYRSVASAIRAGGIKTALEARNAIVQANASTEVTEAWKPFAELITARIKEIASDPKTPVSVVAAYCDEIVKGLEAAHD